MAAALIRRAVDRHGPGSPEVHVGRHRSGRHAEQAMLSGADDAQVMHCSVMLFVC